MRRIGLVLWLFSWLFFGLLVKEAHAEPATASLAALAGWLGTAILGAGAATSPWWLGGGKKAKGGYTPYQLIHLPQYSRTEPRLGLQSDMLTDLFNQQRKYLETGELPPYLRRGSEASRSMLEEPLYKTYFGRPGERTGAITAAGETGALSGLGPKSLFAQTSKKLQDYEESSKQIDNFLFGYAMEEMYRRFAEAGQQSISMPSGPPVMGAGGQAYNIPAEPNYLAEGLGSMGQAMPWLMSMMNTGTTDTGTISDYMNPKYRAPAGYGSEQYNSYPDYMNPQYRAPEGYYSQNLPWGTNIRQRWNRLWGNQ